jgi:hypothetical protein
MAETKTKKETKPKEPKAKAKLPQFVALVQHLHPDGSCTYACKTLKIAQTVAVKIVVDQLSEFDEDSFVPNDVRLSLRGMVQKAVDCFQAVLDGNYPLAVDLYNSIDPTIHIGIDPKVAVEEVSDKFDKAVLRDQLAKFIMIRDKKEDAGGEEETEAKAEGGDRSGSPQVTNSAAGGVAAGGYGS